MQVANKHNSGNTRGRRRLSTVAWLAASALVPASMAHAAADSPAVSAGARLAAQQASEAPAVAGLPYSLNMSLGLQASYTDNVKLTDVARKGDEFARAYASVNGAANTPSLKARVAVSAFYDYYAQTTSYNGGSYSGQGDATLNLVNNVLYLEGAGTRSLGNYSTFGTTDFTRGGTAGRYSTTTFYAGPRFKSALGELASVDVAARYAEVAYKSAGPSLASELPRKSSLTQLVGALDTQDRLTNLQLTTSGEFERDDNGFKVYNAIQSAYVRVAPRLRLVGRAGYDYIAQPGVTTIEAGLFSVGGEFIFNPASRASVEVGRRYNRTVWTANARILAGRTFSMTASYRDTIEPGQVSIGNAFVEFIDTNRDLAAPTALQQFALNSFYYSESSNNRVANVSVAWSTPKQGLELGASHSDRRFLTSQAKDITWSSNIVYRRQLRADLTGTATLLYFKNSGNTVYQTSGRYRPTGDSFEGRADLAYAINDHSSLRFGYRYHKYQTNAGLIPGYSENLVTVAFLRTFP